MKGSFEKFELMGKLDKVKEKDFFLSFIRDCTKNIEELTIDSIFKQE